MRSTNKTIHDSIQSKKPENETLLIDKIKIPVFKDGSKELKQKIIKIDLNGGRLYKLSGLGNTNYGKQNYTVQQIENPESSFPILPETEVYQIYANDDGLNTFLKQINVSKQKSEAICLYANTRDGSMFPLIFESPSACVRFHEAVLVYKLYHRHLPGFKQVCQKGNISASMNLRLLKSLAKSLVSQNIVIDPQDFSIVQLQQFELEVMKDAIEQFITKSNAESRLSSKPGNRNLSISNLLTLFSLQLRYKIVDQVSLNYLRQIISEQILYKNMRQFSISKCSVNDRMLSIMLKQEQSGSFVLRNTNLYENLVKLDLSNNDLTDMSFLTLSVFFGYTPKLSDLCLSGNFIKLESIMQIKKQDKQNRMSKIRMSTGYLPTSTNKNQPPLLTFLNSLQYLPLNYLNLDNNLIEDPELLVTYIIEAENVPIRYLSIKNNRISEVDKIRMAKLIMNEVKERKDGGSMVTVDFGYISVVDQEVYQYVMLLKDKYNQLGLETQDINLNESRRSTRQITSLTSLDLKKFEANQPNYVKVSLTLNKEWQLCDQEGILQVSNLYKSRRKTSMRRSQIVNNILMSGSLSPSNSSSNLKKDDKPFEIDQITAQNFKPTVQELNKAYISNNYSAIHLYKSLLKQYNIQLYNKKVATIFAPYEKQVQDQQKRIIQRLNQFINFELDSTYDKNSKKLSGFEFYQKMNAIISKLFMLRFQNEVKQSIMLYEGTFDEVEQDIKFTWNVFTYLLYLKYLCDEKIEKMIQANQNPLLEIMQKFRDCPNLYTQYYLVYRDELCDDNYEQILNQMLKQVPKNNSGQNKQAQDPVQSASKCVQKQINELLREKYLKKSKVCVEDLKEVQKITEQQKFLCIVEPRLMFTGYLIKHYCPRYIPSEKRKIKVITPTIKSNLHVNRVKMAEPISKNITNFLSFISTYDMLSAPPLCINPNIPASELPNYQSLKLSVYNPTFEPILQKFSSIVIAFMKFLHHSPNKVAPQTLQYLSYLINMVLSEEDSYNVECLSTQFYIQLFTFNAELDVEARSKQIDPRILLNLVQFTSLYMHHSQMIEDYIIGHLLRAEMTINKSNKVSSCRMLRHEDARYHRRQDQLPPQVINHIFMEQHQTPNWLEFALQINYLDPSEPGETKIVIHMHLLASIEDLYVEVQKIGLPRKLGINEDYIYSGEIVEGNKNWGLFLFDLSSHKSNLLLPSSTQKMSIYTLYRSSILSPTSQKKQIYLKPLFLSFPSPLSEFTNELQTRWYFQQIYQAFRDYGSYLSMISIKEESTHISQVAVECMLCHILLEEKEKIEEIVSMDTMWRREVQQLAENYSDQLEEFCPKGTASTLSSQQKKFISEDVYKDLEAIVTTLRNMEQYYSQILHKKIGLFEERCHLLTCASGIYSPLSQQELLFTTYGLVQIKRTIYVEAIHWQDVYNINVVYESDEVNIKCIEIWCQGREDTIMKIVGIPHSNDDKIFLNACLIMIKNVALRFLRVSLPNLFRHISKFNGLDEEQRQSTIQQKIKETNSTKSPTLNVWQELNNHIQYALAIQKQPINLEQIKQQPIPSVEEQNQNYSVPTSNQIKSVSRESKEEIIVEKNEEEQKPKQSKPEIEENIEINSIIKKVQQDAKKEDDDENVVVTNSRKSSRRELPKRRSSRDK